jgi:hypothetical protein
MRQFSHLVHEATGLRRLRCDALILSRHLALLPAPSQIAPLAAATPGLPLSILFTNIRRETSLNFPTNSGTGAKIAYYKIDFVIYREDKSHWRHPANLWQRMDQRLRTSKLNKRQSGVFIGVFGAVHGVAPFKGIPRC